MNEEGHMKKWNLLGIWQHNRMNEGGYMLMIFKIYFWFEICFWLWLHNVSNIWPSAKHKLDQFMVFFHKLSQRLAQDLDNSLVDFDNSWLKLQKRDDEYEVHESLPSLAHIWAISSKAGSCCSALTWKICLFTDLIS